MCEMLKKAKTGGYAVGFFDTINVEMARAVIETAEELKAPVIVGTAEILLPVMALDRTAEFLIPMAQKASVPVAVHYDHGLTFKKCMEALKLGYSSIMYDCSTASYEENLENVAEMVRICHAMGVSVEAELGHVGDNEGAGRLEGSVDVREDDQQICVAQNRHHRRKHIVVAKQLLLRLDLLIADGVVLIDNGDDLMLQQRLEGVGKILLLLLLTDVIRVQKDLSHGLVVIAKELIVQEHILALAHGCRSLLKPHLLRLFRQVHLVGTHGDRTGRNQHHLIAHVLNITKRSGKFFHQP